MAPPTTATSRRSARPRRVERPTPADVRSAWLGLRRLVAPTPLVASPGLGPGTLLKLETLQPTGSFKVRGALSALMRAQAGEPVVTASAGNHGLGVAYASVLLGVAATVVVPETASPAKLSALRRFPVRLVRSGRTYDEAEAAALALAAGGLRYVSPYNDRFVIAGQGTIAIELLRAVEGPMTIVCPLGGGGLVAGVTLWATQRPDVRVVGVECEGAAAMRAALDAGRIVPIPVRPTLADGLGGNLEPGSVTFDLARELVTEVVVVGEAEIEEAMRFLLRAHGLVVEGAGAAAVAGLLSGRLPPGAGPLVALVTGRNVALATVARVAGSGG